MESGARTKAAPAWLAGLSLALLGAVGPAGAALNVADVYSSADGEYQAVVLEDDAHDGVDRFTGITLSIEERGGATRSFTLYPSRMLAPPVVLDSKRRLLVGTRLLAQRLQVQAELPDAFVPVDGGTLTLRAMPQRVRPHALPAVVAGRVFESAARPATDALARHPRASSTTPLVDADPWTESAPGPIVREYWNAELDHYFLASSQHEKATLDFVLPRPWQRTGRYFRALSAETTRVQTVAVCRYYLPPPHGDTHVFAASPDECERVPAAMPHAILETREAFRVALPDPLGGECMPQAALTMPASTPRLVPVYRAWNARPDTNHRYTTHADDRDDMAARGWMPEGYGPARVSLCVDAFDIPATPVPKLPPKLDATNR